MKKVVKRITRKRNEKGELINRGLAFDFRKIKNKALLKTFGIGKSYRAVVDVKTKKIFIIPTEKGKDTLTVSKKKTVNGVVSLIDNRRDAVKNALKDAEVLDIIIKGNLIVVEGYVKEKENDNLSSIADSKVIDLELARLKKVGRVVITKKQLKKVVGDSIYCSLGDENLENVIKVVSLFSGAGMLDYGFTVTRESSVKDTDLTNATTKNKKQCKFKVIYALEKDKGACESYRANIGAEHLIEGDIMEVDTADIPKGDVALAGIPCKPFSNANRTKMLEDHEDSKLLVKTIEIINEKQFPIFVIENVPQILSASNSRYLNLIKEGLSEYNIEVKVLQDNDYGGYTKRKRAFIIGSRIGKVDFSVAPKKQGGTVRQALSKVDCTWPNMTEEDITTSDKETQERMSYVPMSGNWRSIPKHLMNEGMLKTVAYEEELQRVIEESKGNKSIIKQWKEENEKNKGGTQANIYHRLHLDKPCCTLVNYRKPLITHPTENRILYVSEASALSGFGKEFAFKGTKGSRQQQVGNGVPLSLGQAIRTVVEDVFIRALETTQNSVISITEKVQEKQVQLIEKKNGQMGFAI